VGKNIKIVTESKPPIKGLLSMPPNSQPANPTHGVKAASHTLSVTKKEKNIPNELLAK